MRREGLIDTARPPLRVPKKLVVIVLAVAVIVAAVVYLAPFLPSPPTFQHIHPRLTITINGDPVTIPAGIGIGGQTVGSIHTHDTDGVIHVESRDPKTVGDFFRAWGQPFDSSRILTYEVDATHTLTMTVDGQPNSEFDRLVFEDGQVIAIFYGPR